MSYVPLSEMDGKINIKYTTTIDMHLLPIIFILDVLRILTNATTFALICTRSSE